MMEMIRNYLLHKMAQKKEVADKCWPTRAGVKCTKCHVNHHQHVVDLKCFTCTCKKWDLTGIPCLLVVSCMVLENLKPESFVHNCYKIETQQLIYSSLIKPMRGPNQWVTNTTCESVLPPKLRRPPAIRQEQFLKVCSLEDHTNRKVDNVCERNSCNFCSQNISFQGCDSFAGYPHPQSGNEMGSSIHLIPASLPPWISSG
ncbi:hypothetical protein V6N13_124259 [Hibiscus sabdariffa]